MNYNTFQNIQNIMIENLNVLTDLAASLQKEFEYMFSYTSDEKVLKAKRKQIEKLTFIINDQKKVLNATFSLFENQEKTEYCLINYGVSILEYQLFLTKPLNLIIEMAKEQKQNKTAQLPIIFKSYLDYSNVKPEQIKIKYSEKPVLGLSKIKELAKIAGPSF